MIRSATLATIGLALAPTAPGGRLLSQGSMSQPISVTGPVKRLDGSVLAATEVEKIVTGLMAAAKVTGLGLAILNGADIVYLKAFGQANVERSAKLDVQTTMYAASFTKAMFAHLVMQLVEEGRFELDRPIHLYLPRPLPSYEKYADLASDERYRLISGRMLLSHTAGFPNFRFVNPDGKLDIKYPPSTRYAYSGEGINLLQFVLEEGLGLDVGQLMRERVFTRFGMTKTSMVWDSAFEANHAIGYDEGGKPLGYRKRTSVRAAGTAASTITDMARFARGVLREEGLTRKSWDEMFSPAIRVRSRHQFPTISDDTTSRDDGIRLSYGLGWGLFWSPYGKAYFKEGHDDGWENYLVLFDEPKTGIVLMSNSANGESIFAELLDKLIGDRFTPSEWNRYLPYQQERRPE